MIFLCISVKFGFWLSIVIVLKLLKAYIILLQVEKLIKELPSIPEDWSSGNPTEKGQLSNGISVQHAENGTNLRETQSMLLERIASEMNRLKFYITHAQVFFNPHIESLHFCNHF